jgi:hypothetical protein
MDASSAGTWESSAGEYEKTVSAAEAALAHVAALSTGAALDRELRVTVHFHPDVVFREETVLAALAREGVYRSQFETGLGNGGLTAHPGGARWLWESRMFGGCYDSAPASARPKYGSLNHRPDRYGGSPRFGSCYLRLAAHTLERTTFCFPDSVFEPDAFGTAARMNLIGMVETTTVTDPLDHYIEAHLHGPLFLVRDVEELILDPSYRDTPIHATATTLPCPLGWHDGYTLDVDRIRAHPGYRGPSVVELGEAIADEHGTLTPRVLGAVRSWADPQELKQVWHYLARFGRQDRTSHSWNEPAESRHVRTASPHDPSACRTT